MHVVYINCLKTEKYREFIKQCMTIKTVTANKDNNLQRLNIGTAFTLIISSLAIGICPHKALVTRL